MSWLAERLNRAESRTALLGGFAALATILWGGWMTVAITVWPAPYWFEHRFHHGSRRRLFGGAHLGAAALILLGVAGSQYSWLALGTNLFAFTVGINLIGLLARFLPLRANLKKLLRISVRNDAEVSMQGHQCENFRRAGHIMDRMRARK